MPEATRHSAACIGAGIALVCALIVHSATAMASQSGHAPEGTGSPLTPVELATAYEHGEGVPKDYLRAAALYCDEARAGNAEAAYRLGWMYANGRGVARDDEYAAELFTRAAGSGHQHAARLLRYVGAATARIPSCLEEPKVIAIAALAPEAATQDPPDELDGLFASPDKQAIIAIVNQLAPSYSISPRLALAVIKVESDFKIGAKSPKNAGGLMQLIPETAERFRVKNVFDPVQNIRGGLSYLRWLLAYYRGQVGLALAAYNAGEGAVDRYRGVPPYRETQQYVARIRALFKNDEHPYNDGVTGASPALFARGKVSR